MDSLSCLNSSARLQLIVEIPNEEPDGEPETLFYDCNNDDTVGKAGIGPESSLRVSIIGQEEEEVQEGESF